MQASYEKTLEWNRTLRLEQAALLDPMRIDVLARNRLGLDEPSAGQVVPVSPQGPASVASAPVFARAEETEPNREPRRVSLAD